MPCKNMLSSTVKVITANSLSYPAKPIVPIAISAYRTEAMPRRAKPSYHPNCPRIEAGTGEA